MNTENTNSSNWVASFPGGIERIKHVSPLRSRFSEAPWFDWLQNRRVLVIGAGGIGSWVCLCLARIGCSVTVLDHDMIETHNLGGQMFMAGQVNTRKVNAVAQNCASFAGADSRVTGIIQEYNKDTYSDNIVIMAVDNMKTRKIAFDNWKDLTEVFTDKKVCLFIDGRLLAEDYQVYAVTTGREEEYEKTLFNDAEVPTEQCTLKATTHCSLGIASDIVGVLTNFAANRVTMEDPNLQVELRDVPFKIVKSIPNFMYDITLINERPEGKGRDKDSVPSSKEGADNRGVLEVHSEQHKVQPVLS